MTFTHDEYVQAILELSAQFSLFSTAHYLDAMHALEEEFAFVAVSPCVENASRQTLALCQDY